MVYSICARRGSITEFQALNRVYEEGELLLEEQGDGSYKLKAGDGSRTYNNLPYVGEGGVGSNSFSTVAVPSQSSVVADSTADTLTLSGINGITIATDAANDIITLSPTYGTIANTICQGNDGRLTNSRAPIGHNTSHQSGGGDAIKLDSLATPDDVTTLNASSSRHGLLPKLSGDNTQYLNGSGLWSIPPVSGGGRLAVTENLVISGDAGTASTSHIFVGAAFSGTSTSFIVASTTMYCVDKMTSLAAGSTINGIYVNLGTVTGSGRGNRCAGNFVLGHAVATGQSPGDYNDGLAFHTACFATCYCTAGDGGTSGYPRGDFYGFGGIVTLKSTCGLYNHGIIGAEFDVSVESGAGAYEKMILQLVTVNSDAVKGDAVDAGMVLCGDGTVSAYLSKGIAFGKPGARWNIDGDIIGTYSCSNSRACVNGIDFSGVTFSGFAFKSNGFYINAEGDVVAYSLYANNVVGLYAQTAPEAPAGGLTYLYRDVADGKVKLRDEVKTVVLNA